MLFYVIDYFLQVQMQKSFYFSGLLPRVDYVISIENNVVNKMFLNRLLCA